MTFLSKLKNMRPNRVTQEVFGLLSLITVTVLFVVTSRLDGSSTATLMPFSEGWTDESGNTVNIEDIRSDDNGRFPSVTKRLPDELDESECLCFESYNTNLTVTVDDREIYSFVSKENLTGFGYGNAFHQVGLDRDMSGSVIRIDIAGCNPDIHSKRGKVGTIYIGEPVAFVHMVVKANLPAFLASVFIVFFGIVFLLIGFVISDNERIPFDVASLGLTSIFIGSWFLVLTNIFQLITGDVYTVRALNRFLILLSGVPLIGFFNSLTKKKRKIYPLIEFWSSIFLIALTTVLRFFAGIDMMTSFHRVLITYAVEIIILSVVMFAENESYCRSVGTVSGLKYYYAGIAVFFMCAIADFALYYFKRLFGNSYGTIASVGTFVLIPAVMIRFITWWTKDRAVVERERFTNSALQYALSSDSPDESIRLMLEFMGEELKCKRVIVFEDMHNGRYAGKYAWFDKSLGRRSIDLLYVPEKGFVDEVLDSYSANGNSFSISDIETYRDINQNIYNLLRSFDVESLVLNPLSVDGNVTGLLLLLDLPVDLIDEASSVAALTSYFLSQLILRRDDQKRMRTYTYNDSLSGAQNRRAYEEFVRNGLDLSSPFGYLSCEITDLEEISERDGFEAGDRKVIDIVAILGEIFGRGNVYRMVGSRFAAFGFETDETYFRDDVARFKEKVREAGINTAVGYVYCQNGTMDMKTVIRRAGQMIKEEEKNEHKH